MEPRRRRQKRVLFEKRQEDPEARRARHRFAHVVERKREDRLQGGDEPRVRDDGEDLLEPRIAAEQGVEDAQAGCRRRSADDQRDEDDLADRRRIPRRIRRRPSIALAYAWSFSFTPNDSSDLRLLIEHRLLAHFGGEEGEEYPPATSSDADQPGRRASGAGPPRRRRSPGATRRHPPRVPAGSCPWRGVRRGRRRRRLCLS